MHALRMRHEDRVAPVRGREAGDALRRSVHVVGVRLGRVAAMVDEANLRMLYGNMSPAMHTTLVNMLANIGSSGGSSAANEKAWSLVYLISISPE